MTLLDLSDCWRRETGAFLAVGHVDHDLRGAASRADADFVRRQCAARGLPVAVIKAPVQKWAKAHGRGIEDAARTLRYGALAQAARRFRCAAVATGHSLNDQVETVFLHLIRGAGPAGLAGMASDSDWPVSVPGRAPRLLRPLLNVSRGRILAHLRRRKRPCRKDASNDDAAFLRNRLRPVLNAWEKLRPGFFSRVAQTARLLRDEEDYWRRRLSPLRTVGSRRNWAPLRLDIPSFLRYSVVEQRRRLRHLFGLTRFESVERVRAFAAARARGPLDLPGARVKKAGLRLLFLRGSRVTKGTL